MSNQQPKMLQLKVVGLTQEDLVAGLKEALRCVEQGQFKVSLFEKTYPNCFRASWDVSEDVSDVELLPEQLEARYSVANEHPKFTRVMWFEAAANSANTVPTYWVWASSQIHEAAKQVEAIIQERVKRLILQQTGGEA